MQTLHLNENDVTALRGALEIARDRYRENSTELRAMHGHQRLAEQFERQAADAERLIETLDS